MRWIMCRSSTRYARSCSPKIAGPSESLDQLPYTESKLHPTHVPSLFATSEDMAEVRELIEKVAPTSATVLLRGESGVGKELAARLIHSRSLRSGRPFIKVNCAAIPNELLESELFGYEAGAFTGAAKAKPGKFELADGGTIFLDEIGELHPLLQAKLLHVLQDGEFTRLGAKRDTAVDVRIICATNRRARCTGGERPVPGRPFLSHQCCHGKPAAAAIPVARDSGTGGFFPSPLCARFTASRWCRLHAAAMRALTDYHCPAIFVSLKISASAM